MFHSGFISNVHTYDQGCEGYSHNVFRYNTK